jgi:hypothetical protein
MNVSWNVPTIPPSASRDNEQLRRIGVDGGERRFVGCDVAGALAVRAELVGGQ